MVSDWPHLLQGGFFVALLVAAAIWDAKKQIIPDMICLGIALIGLLDFTPEKLFGLLTAAVFLFLALFLGGLFGGDIKFSAAVGLVLGFQKSMTGMILGLILMLTFHMIHTLILKRHRKDIKKSYPLAPFLSIGCLAAYFLC